MFDMFDDQIIFKITIFLSEEDIVDLSLSCKFLYEKLYCRELHHECIKKKHQRNIVKENMHKYIQRIRDVSVSKGICMKCQSKGLLRNDKTFYDSNCQIETMISLICIDDCKYSCLLCDKKIKITQTNIVMEPILCQDCITYYG
jgi:hypothetical protein